MNPLNIYKKLPRTNCGKCPAKTCISFSIKITKGELSSTDCPELDKSSKREIDSMLSKIYDWKDKRLQELFKEISQINFAAIAEGIGAKSKDETLKLRYMGREITVSHSDFAEQLDIWDKLLILMYIRTAGNCPLSGKWVAFRDLKNGLLRATDFGEICETPLARMFEKNPEQLLKILMEMGAEKIKGQPGEQSLVLYPLPKIPFLILLWHGEEGFEPACKVLLDSTATEFLDIEALLYLGQALIRAIKTRQEVIQPL